MSNETRDDIIKAFEVLKSTLSTEERMTTWEKLNKLFHRLEDAECKDWRYKIKPGGIGAELMEVANERHQKLDLIIGLFPHLYQKINDLEKRLEEAEDQWWMNYDSGVPSEELTTEEILESVKELRERREKQ